MNEIQLSRAQGLVVRSALFQSDMLAGGFANEVIDRSVPVAWFGRMSAGNWVTVGTNPSKKEFLDSHDGLLEGARSRFFVRDASQSLEDFCVDERSVNLEIKSYQTYFNADRNPLTGWFGTCGGGKLEGLINGMGGSFYRNTGNRKPVIHSDFFPVATRNQMSRIANNHSLLDSKFSVQFLRDTLALASPRVIIVLGKDHCERFETVEPDFRFASIRAVSDYPSARYQIGFNHRTLSVVIGCHFKPSEVMAGLGRGYDANGLSHGSYQGKNLLNQIGVRIMESAKQTYPTHNFLEME